MHESQRMSNAAIADRLKTRRAALDLSQYELADASGIARTRIADYEQGRHEPSLDALLLLADALDVSTDWLLGREPVWLLGREPVKAAAKPAAPAKAKAIDRDDQRGCMVDRPSTVDEVQALAKAQGKTYLEHRGRAYRLRKDGWETV